MSKKWVPRADGKPVAWIENRVLKKVVKGSIHFLRQPPAIAWDSCIIFDNRADYDVMWVKDEETDIVYTCSKLTFFSWMKRMNRSHGDQYYLVMGRWTRDDPNQTKLWEGW